MKQKEIKSRNATGSSDPAVTALPPRILKRRRIGLLRSTMLLMVVGAGLIFLTTWYRTWPQDMDCQRMNQRVATAIEDYRQSHRKLPQILALLDVRRGRYSIDHYAYWFEGLGGPGVLPQGTLVAYCKRPHEPMFSEPWRHVIVFIDGEVVVGRMSEVEFQAKIARQLPAEKYWSLPQPFLK